MPIVRIGSWRLDTSDGTLAGNERVTHLEPKLQTVLLVLVDRAGTVVSRDDLLRGAWPDTHVAPGALARTISLLRDALGDDVRQPRYIETVPKRGYRLIAPVQHIDDVACEADPPPPVESAPGEVQGPAPETHRLGFVAAAATVIGLAILAPVDTARHHMTMAIPETRLWHDTRLGNESLFEHYNQMAAREPACPEAQAGLATVFAFRANYLPDRARWVDAAIETARRAAHLDPSSAAAARALAMGYAQAGRLEDAVAHFNRALTLEPADAGTRINRGLMRIASGQIGKGLVAVERYIADHPGSAAGYAYMAGGLAVSGHLLEAADAARAAIARRPYDLTAQMVLVKVDLLGGQLDAARARLERVLEMRPECVQCVVQLGLVDQIGGRDAAALERYRAARRMAPDFAPASLRLAQMSIRAGHPAEATALLAQAEKNAAAAIERGDETAMPRWQLAAAAAVRGDRPSALRHYEHAVAAGRRDAVWDRWDPLLSAIQSDAAFVALLSAAAQEHAAAAPFAARIRAALS